jgi:hypothetical protein
LKSTYPMHTNDLPQRFNRRRFLGGSAVAIALPFLESLVPRSAAAQVAAPKRLLFLWMPNGIYMQKFRPATTGPDWAITPILAPLEPLRADFSVITGLENTPAIPDGVGDHAAGTCAFITCSHANKSQTAIKLGMSADQLAVEKIGKTKLPSLQIGIDGGGSAGDCDSGYSCAYARNISWSSPTTPIAKLTDPATIFNQLFMGLDTTASMADIAKRQAYSKSVLDSVLDDANGLMPKLGHTDTMKMQEYLDGIRELERRIATTSPSVCAPGTKPATPTSYPMKFQIMNDLIVMAFQCDVTRIVTFMLGNAVSNQTHPFLMANGSPITRGHHDISHHANAQANLDMLFEIDRWQMTQLAYLMDKLKKVQDGPDSNLLYNSTIFVSSDVSDGNRHNHDDMPVIVAGHGGGALSPGKHIAYPAANHEKLSNLLLTVIGTVGATGPVGDSTAPLTGI